MTDKELLPCPLCNSDDVYVLSGAAYRVKCMACYTSGSFGEKEEAIKAWNTRAKTQREKELEDMLIAISKAEARGVDCSASIKNMLNKH